jgi:hypothetical protein
MVYMTEVHTIIDVDIPLRRKQHPFIGQLHDVQHLIVAQTVLCRNAREQQFRNVRRHVCRDRQEYQ